MSLFFIAGNASERKCLLAINYCDDNSGDYQGALFVVKNLFQDLRFGARTLLKNPGFALAAIITLALGIGANTSIFTITSAVLLKPLPFRDPQQLLSLDNQQKDGESRCCSLNW